MKTAFKKRDSPTTKLQLSPVLKAPVITPKFPLQLPLRCFDISPFSAKVVLLLYTACRRFSLTKGPVAEKGPIMGDALFLLLQLTSVGREFCMGSSGCELKKMGR